MALITPGQRKVIRDEVRVAMVLGIDPGKIAAESLTLEPFGDDWVVRWSGVAVLAGDAARGLFDPPTILVNGSEQ